MISLDTEDTGLDLRHGAKPFLFTTCNEEGQQSWWEWDVDPITRQPEIPPDDIQEIENLLYTGGNDLVFQNAKFDVTALVSIGVKWEHWSLVQDTLIAGH